ncbi:matrixin family metalloprotease [Priestia megaterium]|uniref:matrixin family metalloprotease n=1 Tax=Priestia megaterium TaxID=1404 RepID=UPI0021F4645F|nr:matrixin family metalloprotease [Priestia megaterium]UYP07494.1 matrixin family metalloprotease [Priestia megaterium]
MPVPCLVIDVYMAPGSGITQAIFDNHRAWVDFVWRRQCGIDIRWRFRNSQGTPVMASLGGPVIVPNTIACNRYDQLNFYLQSWLRYRPTGPGPFGRTSTRDIALYYVQGPLLSNGVGCSPIITPNGPAFMVTNGANGQVVAHELGHLLGLSHVNNVDNLMNPILYRTSYQLTAQQCDIAKSSPYFQSCP